MTDILRRVRGGLGDHDDLLNEAADEIERLRDGLEAIAIYGSDTLSGPAGGTSDTRDWQRAAVFEMAGRAMRVLSGQPWKRDEPEAARKDEGPGA